MYESIHTHQSKPNLYRLSHLYRLSLGGVADLFGAHGGERPPLPPLHKYLIHVTCQASAYVVGVAGWATGLKLGSDSVGIEYNTHRNIRNRTFFPRNHSGI
ncbi:unnamed protein product [Lactuca virosa]|uniref:Uncharacterized protein n=1 Tax=Lactuca virosa TaxID=75947 RepID=A0AAU9LSK5_9ASTR|nr:unnamed protein product [Lactuca virosa]